MFAYVICYLLELFGYHGFFVCDRLTCSSDLISTLNNVTLLKCCCRASILKCTLLIEEERKHGKHEINGVFR
jgi:hypothetical protein